MQIINDNGIGMCIVEDGKKKYVGLVTDGDIRRALIEGYSYQDPIDPIVNRKAVYGLASEDKSNLIAKLNHSLRAIPVLDDEGKLIDLLQYQEHFIPVARPGLLGNELKYLTDCILSNWISSKGEYIDRFEKIFAEFTGNRFALSCSNGTTALHLAILAAGIKKGDEVIVPSFSWIATANAVKYVGANPIFVDVEEETLDLDPEEVNKAISKKTKAVIPVHLYGQPARMNEIKAICDKNNLVLIEDAAEAHGALYEGKKVGSIGEMGCFSFFGNKIVTTGEGGMVTTDNETLYRKMKVLRDHGKSPEDPSIHEVIGYNYRMTNMQAAVGLAQMERIEEIIEDKLRIAKSYKKYLGANSSLIMPPENNWSLNVNWLFCFRLKPLGSLKEVEFKRDKVIRALEKNLIEARAFFNPIHQMPPYLPNKIKLPVTEMVSSSGISLPSFYGMKDFEVEKICNIILKEI
jgi:perosamine synthetase